MKKSNQIIGLPIISIADGNQVGKVKSLVINPDKGSVDFLTIEHEDWQVSVKAIPFKKVIGIGEYAVTVESENAVIDLNEIPIANQLVNKKIRITSTKVMTRKGELLGDITEYFVNQDTGNILGMQLQLAEKTVALPSEAVVTFGKDIIIVAEDATNRFLNTVEELEITEEVVEEIPQPIKEVSKPEVQLELVKEETAPQQPVKMETPELKETEEEIVMEEVELEADEEIRALKQKQINLLTGKIVSKDIFRANGEILFRKGKRLEAKDVSEAQSEGPSVVVDLSMNVEA